MNNDNYNAIQSDILEDTPSKIEYRKSLKYSLIGLGIYAACFYIIATILSFILAAIFTITMNITPEDIKLVTDSYKKYEAAVLSWTNFLTYSAAIIALIPFSKFFLLDDIKLAKKDIKNTLRLVLLGIGIMYAASIFASILVELLTLNIDTSGTSENQETIEFILSSSPLNAVLMCTMTIIFAPILEEIIFRKCIFGLFKNKKILAIAVSAIIFAAIHVVPACLTIVADILLNGSSTLTDLYVEAVYIISYLGQAIAMSYIYYKSNYNIVPSILIHFFNNVIAVIATFLM